MHERVYVWAKSLESYVIFLQPMFFIQQYFKNSFLCQYIHIKDIVSSVMSDSARQTSLSFTISHSLLKLTSIELVMPSSHLILCCTLLLLSSIFPSIKVFPNELALHIRWPEYWGFSFSISPSNEYSGLVSFRIDWLDLLAVQGTFKSLLQYHSSKASILGLSAFFMVQLSHLYITTGKNHSVD